MDRGNGLLATDPLSYVLESLTLVGAGKAIGYLPLRTIRQVLGLKVEDVVADARARGLQAIAFGPRDCCIKTGALYLYDPSALEHLLRTSSVTLERSGFPVDTEMFVRTIARDWLEQDHPVMPIIRAAFADPSRSAQGG